MRPRRRRKKIAIAAVLFLAIGIWAVVIEPSLLITRTLVVRTAKWPVGHGDLKIAFVADTHTGSFRNGLANLRRIVDRVNALKPDLILLGGDYVISGVPLSHHVPVEAIARELARLKAPAGVLGVLGNHDWWEGGDKIRRVFGRAGLRLLENEAVPIRFRGKRFWIVGLADDTTRRPEVLKSFAPVPAAEPAIVLMHDPATFADLSTRPVIALAGHTHGGQLYLPWLGALANASRAPLRHSYGLIREKGKTMYVTSGIGTSILPIRLNIPPEVVLITLRNLSVAQKD